MQPLLAHVGIDIPTTNSTNTQVNAQQIHSYTHTQRAEVIVALVLTILLITVVSLAILARDRAS